MSWGRIFWAEGTATIQDRGGNVLGMWNNSKKPSVIRA